MFEKVEKTVFLGLNFSYTVLYPLYSGMIKEIYETFCFVCTMDILAICTYLPLARCTKSLSQMTMNYFGRNFVQIDYFKSNWCLIF